MNWKECYKNVADLTGSSLSLMCGVQSPVVGRSQGQQQEKKQFDLLSDLGSDIFAAPAPQSTATANFANFAHFISHAGKCLFSTAFCQARVFSTKRHPFF